MKPSAYMKTKLNKIAKYLTPDYTTVKPSPQSFKAYKKAPSEITPFATMGRVVVKNDPGAISTVRKGMITRIRKLKNGEFEKIILPITPQDLLDFNRLVELHPEWDFLLKVTTDDDDTSEKFAFIFRGHPSLERYGSLAKLAEDLNNFYLAKLEPDDPGFFTNTGHEPDAPYVELYREYKDWDWDGFRVEGARERQRKKTENFMRSLTPQQRQARTDRRARARAFQPSYEADLKRRKAERNRERETGKRSPEREAELKRDRERKRKQRATKQGKKK